MKKATQIRLEIFILFFALCILIYAAAIRLDRKLDDLMSTPCFKQE